MTNNNNSSNGLQVQPKTQTKADLMLDFFKKETVQAQLQNTVQDNKESFIASVIDLYTGDTYLQGCQPELVAMQALKAAVMKLPVIKSLGFAYIVPYKKNGTLIPQLQIGYKGLIQLAIRTNQYEIINADVVFEGEYRTQNKLTGEFDLSGSRTSDKIIGYFAHFRMTNGFSKTLFMTKEKVIAHAQKYSKSYNEQFSPWKTEFDAMAIKTVLRGLLSHWGYLSTEMQNAITDEDRDVADKVLEEVRTKANQKNMSGFEEAHEVKDETINQNQTAGAPF
jgi:recombination protein RecT